MIKLTIIESYVERHSCFSVPVVLRWRSFHACDAVSDVRLATTVVRDKWYDAT